MAITIETVVAISVNLNVNLAKSVELKLPEANVRLSIIYRITYLTNRFYAYSNMNKNQSCSLV